MSGPIVFMSNNANIGIATIQSSTTTPFNLKTTLTNAGWNGTDVIDAVCTVNSSINQGSTSNSTPAWQTGTSWPAGSTIKLIIKSNGTIAGAGGAGGTGGKYNTTAQNGYAGGTAIEVNFDITIENNSAVAGGGGGGGGGNGASRSDGEGGYIRWKGGGGGGGAGNLAGTGGTVASTSGSTSGNGNGGTGGTYPGSSSGGSASNVNWAGDGGAGGNMGTAGTTPSLSGGTPRGTQGSGGAAGNYIVSNSNTVTWSVTGTRTGGSS